MDRRQLVEMRVLAAGSDKGDAVLLLGDEQVDAGGLLANSLCTRLLYHSIQATVCQAFDGAMGAATATLDNRSKVEYTPITSVPYGGTMRTDFPGRGQVAILRTNPKTVLEDYACLMELAGAREALPQDKETILKINVS